MRDDRTSAEVNSEGPTGNAGWEFIRPRLFCRRLFVSGQRMHLRSVKQEVLLVREPDFGRGQAMGLQPVQEGFHPLLGHATALWF
jgi:hypothetical protein